MLLHTYWLCNSIFFNTQVDQLRNCQKLLVQVNDTANDDIFTHIAEASDFIHCIISDGGSGILLLLFWHNFM